jgi:hypothetical protein
MNGYWKLRECSDIFPSSSLTNSVISPSTTDVYFIRIILGKSINPKDKIYFRRYQNDFKEQTCDSDLKALQYFEASSTEQFFTVFDADQKFEQLIIHSFGPNPMEKW